jgi:hypothetical protein
MTDHVNTAKGMLTMAATARNSDGWGNADSLQALGVCALAHATLAIVERLDALLEISVQAGRP